MGIWRKPISFRLTFLCPRTAQRLGEGAFAPKPGAQVLADGHTLALHLFLKAIKVLNALFYHRTVYVLARISLAIARILPTDQFDTENLTTK